MKFVLTLKHWQLFVLFVLVTLLEHFTIGAWEHVGVLFPLLWAFTVGYYAQRQLQLFNPNPPHTAVLIISNCFIALVAITAWLYTSLPQPAAHVLDYLLPNLICLAIVAGFYNIFSAAKALAKLEHRREVKFIEYFDNVLYLCVPMAGIWVIQPKVNRLLGQQSVVL